MGLKQFLFGKLNRKIISGFLVIGLLFIALGGFSLYQCAKIQDISEEEIYKGMTHLNNTWTLMEIQRHKEIASNNYLFLNTESEGWKADYFYEKEHLKNTYQEYYSESCEHVKLWLKKYHKNIQLFDVKIEEAFELHEQKADLEIIKTKAVEANEYSRIAYEDYLKKIIAHIQEDHIEPAKQQVTTKLDNSKIVILITSIVALLLSVFVGYFISRGIVKPIKQLSSSAYKMEGGDFDAKVNIKTGDELERLGNTFNKVLKVLSIRNKEHKQLERAKTEFLSITSHELRSPMTPMKAQLQMLIENYFGKVNLEQKESLNIVLKNTERLDDIIRDFLEISRIEVARLKFKFVRADIRKYAQRLIKEMVGFMPKKRITIATRIGKIPIIESDPNRIMQVLRNLISNAIKFTPKNGKIIISIGLGEGVIKFSVQDNGVGIKPEDQRRLFEPFFQAEQIIDVGKSGTGLGLAISKGIVETQGGKIWFKSEFGKGTTFFFTVPLRPVKKIMPIRLLFSSKTEIDEKIKKILIDVLGPMGEKEFERLEKSGGISEESVIRYIKLLEEKGILKKEVIEQFKNKILFISGKTQKIKSEELAKEGLIKKNKRGKNEN
ncbi:HAMP domain-containing histidine kinase [Candidatus Pacearchaeota archaeon]|nr:HAMP domain-containing histidine kinase [Candidatus Pacearchaeota archaeon]